MATSTKTKPARTMSYDNGLLTIKTGGKRDEYAVEAIRDEGALLGVRMTKLATGQSYDVDLIDLDCECLGRLRWGCECKHLASARKLVAMGKIA